MRLTLVDVPIRDMKINIMRSDKSQIMHIDYKVLFRNLFIVFISIVVFLLRRHYSGPMEHLVHAYSGNFVVSFALYFVIINSLLQLNPRWSKILAVVCTLSAVESFEAFNGFGLMINTYDPFDFIANAAGVGLALGLDILLGRKKRAAW